MKKRKIYGILLLILLLLFICVMVGIHNNKPHIHNEKEDIPEEDMEVKAEKKPDVEPEKRLEKESEKKAEAEPEKEPEKEAEPEKKAETEPEEQKIQPECFAAGQIVDEKDVVGMEDKYFQSYEITEGDAVHQRINGQSYYANADISLKELRYLKLLHYNFNHEIQVGELIVNAKISSDVIHIFKELFEVEYEINSMYLIDDFWTGDPKTSDDNSIAHNNSSAFCYRQIVNGKKLSRHALGLAIDINPRQNPYVRYVDGEPQCEDVNAIPYLERNSGEPHMITENDICYKIFDKYGFKWGGAWKSLKDYQHFEK